MTGSHPSPPRLAEWLATRVLRNSSWSDSTLGDLREEFVARRLDRGAWHARLWYWRELPAIVSEARRHRRRAAGRDPVTTTVVHECRLALRALRRQPVMSVVIILTFAVGIGANAATFGIADALLLRPFTIPNVDRLVVISESSIDETYPLESFTSASFTRLRTAALTTLTPLTAMRAWEVNLAAGDQLQRVNGTRVGADFFTLLGTPVVSGRTFTAADDAAGAARTVIISDGLWRTLGAGADVVGSTLTLDGEPYTVIGRAPSGFDFPQGTDVWAPLMLPATAANTRERRLTVIAALTPTHTINAAQAELAAVHARLSANQPPSAQALHVRVHPFSRAMVDFAMPLIVGLWQGAALLLLLIAGTNIANLLLARGAERQREMAIRLAVGAARRRLIRLMLVENLILACLAIPAALAFAWAGMALVRSTLPASLVHLMPGWSLMGLSGRTVAVTTAVAVGSAVIFGLLPALRASAVTPMSVLKDGGRSGSAGVSRNRLRRGLVVAELALALPVLLASGLIVVAGQRLAHGAQGYNPDDLVRLRVSLSPAIYPDADAQRAFTRRLLEEASAMPGVRDVATTNISPSSNWNESRPLVRDGLPAPARPRAINYRAVSDRFFETMQIPVRQGRGFTGDDRHGSAHVAIVSESLAALYWPDASPLGQRIRLTPSAPELLTIVGVSANVIDDWSSARNMPTVYVPVDQWPTTQVDVLARGAGDPGDRLAALRVAVARIDPALPPFGGTTMRDAIAERTNGLRFISRLMAAFGVLGLLLAIAGIYSVMAHHVAQRRHEIGIRMALGASAQQVLALTLRHGLSLAGLGVAVGLGLGIGVNKLMEAAFFGLVSFDPALFIGVPVTLILVATVATLVPARRAMRVDPTGILRD